MGRCSSWRGRHLGDGSGTRVPGMTVINVLLIPTGSSGDVHKFTSEPPLATEHDEVSPLPRTKPNSHARENGVGPVLHPRVRN